MLQNHLKTTLRNSRRNFVIPLINVFGLSTGVAALFLILTYSSYERSYEDFHIHKAQVYRVVSNSQVEGEIQNNAAVYSAVGPAMKSSIPEVLNYTRLFARGEVTVGKTDGSKQSKSFIEKKVFFAEPSIFEIFSFRLVRGDKLRALDDPFAAVLSESLAKKYFPNDDPVGSIIKINDQFGQSDYTITGVFEEQPTNSHLRIDMLTSYSTLARYLGDLANNDWNINWFYTYALFSTDLDQNTVEAKINQLLSDFKGTQLSDANRKEVFSLQPVEKIHLHSNLTGELEANGNARTVQYLIGIAALVLIVAWLNYINLSTVSTLTRQKEVGVRKVIGASKRQLIFQYFIESAAVQVIAALIGFLVFTSLLPKFSQLVGKPLTLAEVPFSFLMAIVLGGIVVSSLYVSWFVSNFNSTKVLTVGGDTKLKGIGLKRSLVVFQFAISAMILSFTYVVNRQIHFITNKDLGMDINKILVVKGPTIHDSLNVQKMDLLKQNLIAYPTINKVALSRYVPGVTIATAQGSIKRIEDQDKSTAIFGINSIDQDFFETYQVKLVAGRNFSVKQRPDQSVIINESASRLLGFEHPLESINQEISFPYGGVDMQGGPMTIIGVVQDYHQVSLKELKMPIVFWSGVNSEFSLKITPQNIDGTLNLVKEKFSHFFPVNPMEYHFLSDSFNQQYQSELRFEKAMNWFSVLSVIITCLGLFGLASFTIRLRNKEVGIRKVLGANFATILFLLSKDYVKLMLVASLIALPLVYKLIIDWLQSFAYQIELTLWLFILPIGLIFLIAIITILYHSVVAAKINLIESIRLE